MVFHIYQDFRGEWRWYLRSPSGGKLATSGQGYTRRNECVSAIQRLRSALSTEEASIVYDNVSALCNMASTGQFASAINMRASSV